MITCGKRANSALTAHDHEKTMERAPALRSPAGPGGASGANGVIDDAAIPRAGGIGGWRGSRTGCSPTGRGRRCHPGLPVLLRSPAVTVTGRDRPGFRLSLVIHPGHQHVLDDVPEMTVRDRRAASAWPLQGGALERQPCRDQGWGQRLAARSTVRSEILNQPYDPVTGQSEARSQKVTALLNASSACKMSD
jgi:hypothetical protein